MSFWETKPESKRRYLVTHIKRTQEKYNIRDVQLSKVLTLSEELLMDNFIAFFETLPINYQKAFKSAWRQKEHKANNSSKRAIELSETGYSHLHVLLSLYKQHDPDFNHEELSKQAQIEYILDKSCDLLLDNKFKHSVTK